MGKTFRDTLWAEQRKPDKQFYDDVLGELRFYEENNCWDTFVQAEGHRVHFAIGGNPVPDQKLITHARDIIRTFPKFKELVHSFLEDQWKSERWARAAAEIQGLVIDEIALCWPETPNDGMIFFRGPDPNGRAWRCDYKDGRPRELAFDD